MILKSLLSLGGDTQSLSRSPFKLSKDSPNRTKTFKDSSAGEELHWNKLGLMMEIADAVESSLECASLTPIQKLTTPMLL